MTIFTTYDDDGRILGWGRASNPEEQSPGVGGVFIGAQFDAQEFYFVGDVPTPRPDTPSIALSATTVLANGTATIDLTGVPAGAQVVLNQTVIEADGTTINVSTDLVGENIIKVDCFPAKPWRGAFNGTAT